MSQRLRNAAVVVALFAAIGPVTAQPTMRASANACAVHAPEAANRSGLPVDVVLRVMMAESGDNPRIVSSKGAMGCMQIMPATWTYLTGRHGLGSDPFDARMNMIAGAMYLDELTSRYGAAGALAAYNAGPGRYERYVAGTQPLPAETIAYAARIGRGSRQLALPPSARWQEASLFLAGTAPTRSAEPSPSSERRRPRSGHGSLFPLATAEQPGDADLARP